MSDNKPIVIEDGILRESSTTGSGVDITSSDPALTVTSPSANTYVLGFSADLAKVPNLQQQFIAGATISALKVVYIALDGKVYPGSNEGTYAQALVTGVAVNSSLIGGPVDVMVFGILEDSSWAWAANTLLFINVNGNITSTPPVLGYSVRIGKALTPTTILIDVQEPIQL